MSFPSPLVPLIPASIEQHVVAWRLPYEVSQSKLCDREKPSNACALIALKIAEVLHRNGIEMPVAFNKVRRHHELVAFRVAAGVETKPLHCPQELFNSLIEGIILGNEDHELAVKEREEAGLNNTPNYQNFTVPDALIGTGKNFREVDYCSIHGAIEKYFHRLVWQAITSSLLKLENRLYLVMIACERAVLLVYDRISDTITMFDTHSHFSYVPETGVPVHQGSIIATCKSSHVRSFAKWMVRHIFPEDYTDFEVSLITFCGEVRPDDCASGNYWPLPTLSIFNDEDITQRNALKRPMGIAQEFQVVTKKPLLSFTHCQTEDDKENQVPINAVTESSVYII